MSPASTFIDASIKNAVLDMWAYKSNSEIRRAMREQGIDLTANQILDIINRARMLKDPRAIRKHENAVYG